jgi:two-component system, OmpR family, sensor histidine kinase KdpD
MSHPGRSTTPRVPAPAKSQAPHDGWPPHERLLVCVGARASDERLVREGARLAQRLQADWSVVHVDRSTGAHHPAEREALLQLAKLAESLGSELVTIPGERVADTLVNYAQAHHATRLILGHRPHRWPKLWHKSIADRMAQAEPELSLLLLPPSSDRSSRYRASSTRKRGTRAMELFFSVLACMLTTLVAALLLRVFDLSNVVMLFLLTVVLVALRWGRLAGGAGGFRQCRQF